MSQQPIVNFTENLDREKRLESEYLSYHVPSCPLPLKITCSLAQFARRASFELPTKFTELDYGVNELKTFVEKRLETTGRADNFQDSDYVIYIAWRVWKHKCDNPEEFMTDEGRGLAELYAMTKTFGKLTGKVTKERKLLQECATEEEWKQKGFKRLDSYSEQLTNLLALTSKIINTTSNENQLLIEGAN